MITRALNNKNSKPYYTQLCILHTRLLFSLNVLLMAVGCLAVNSIHSVRCTQATVKFKIFGNFYFFLITFSHLINEPNFHGQLKVESLLYLTKSVNTIFSGFPGRDFQIPYSFFNLFCQFAVTRVFSLKRASNKNYFQLSLSLDI